MKKGLFTILLIFILASAIASAQTLRIERTDVDTTRESFITATYIFGIDIIFDDVDSCSGAAFEIIYDHSEYIKFSEYSLYEFGKGTNPVVIHSVDIDGRGRINVGIGSGISEVEKTFDSPRVIKLEFVVMQYAPRDLDVTFSFPNPKAIVLGEMGGEIVTLEAEDRVFKIHSFIDVWPGDADNNGVVNNDDLGVVQKYLGLGSNTKNMRSFKRLNASTVWTKQRVLAWDNFDATYADCDGSGDITNSDMLVISYNWNRDTTMQNIERKPVNNDAIQNNNLRQLSPNEIALPIYVNSHKAFHALTGEFSISNIEGYELIELAKGNVFNDDAFFTFKVNNGSATFAAGNTINRQLPALSGTIAYAIFKSTDDFVKTPELPKITLKAISENGHFFTPEALTSIKNSKPEANEQKAYYNNGILYLQLDDNPTGIRIYNSLGQLAYKDDKPIINSLHYLPDLSSGIYFAEFHFGNENHALTIPFIVTR